MNLVFYAIAIIVFSIDIHKNIVVVYNSSVVELGVICKVFAAVVLIISILKIRD